jgi:putative transposase
MARSTFHYHLKQTKKPDKYLETIKDISRIYKAHQGRMGYRRIKLELRNEGRNIYHKTVLKLMQELGIQSLIRAEKYRSYKGEQGEAVANLFKRDFRATSPDQKWATDISEFKVSDKKLYLSPIIDLFNGELISYTKAENAKIKPVIDMVEQLKTTSLTINQ